MDKLHLYAEYRFSYAIPKHEIICAIWPDFSKKRTFTLENLLLKTEVHHGGILCDIPFIELC